MNKFIVTIKMPRNPDHDPQNKKTGACPVSESCTDVTGAHHSFLEYGKDVNDIQSRIQDRGWHVTRIEEVLCPEITKGRLPSASGWPTSSGSAASTTRLRSRSR